jgi:phosphatidate cytidylyltransferase
MNSKHALVFIALLLCSTRSATSAAKTFNLKKLHHHVKLSPSPNLSHLRHSSHMGGKTSFCKSTDAIEQPGPTPTSNEASALSKRVVTSLFLSLVWTPLCFAGKPVFSLALLPPLMQSLKEFHLFIDNTQGLRSVGFGVGIASTLASCFMACYDTSLHPFVIPLSVIALMLQLLYTQRDITPTGDIASSVFSFIYTGHFMSYWIRLLDIKSIDFTNLPKEKLGPLALTSSAFLLWWSFAIIASADIGGYVLGRAIGAHPVSEWGVAGGTASPGKTAEGLLGGVVFAISTTLLGVLTLRPVVRVGPSETRVLGVLFSLLYGTLLAVLSFTSDVSVSMLKRNAGVKDSGRVLPGHGGVLDRMDSYLLSAPVIFFLWTLCTWPGES